MNKTGAFLILLLLANFSYAISGMVYSSGTSSISFSVNSISMRANSSISLSYSVNLVSGVSLNTMINIANNNYLQGSGINVILNTSTGLPPFSGNVLIKVGASTKPGSYLVLINATGSDPSVANAQLMLNVGPSTSATSTTTTTTTTIQQGSEPATTKTTVYPQGVPQTTINSINGSGTNSSGINGKNGNFSTNGSIVNTVNPAPVKQSNPNNQYILEIVAVLIAILLFIIGHIVGIWKLIKI